MKIKLIFLATALFATPALAQPADDAGPAIELAPEQEQPSIAPAAPAESGDTLTRGLRDQRLAVANQTPIGGYGELHFNRVMPENGNSESEIDFHRLVLFVSHQFDERLRFYSELEVEHALVGDGKPGEVGLEQAFVNYMLTDGDSGIGELGLRAGIVLVPMGIINQWHEPPIFHGVERPGVNKNIIPSTWREGGLGVFGKLAALPGLSYELYLMGGLDASGFSAGSGIRGGRQKVAEARADGLAVAGRVEYEPMPALVLGLSGYFGLAGPNISDAFDTTGAQADIDVPVTGFAADVRGRNSGLEWRAMIASFLVGDTEELADLRDEAGAAIGPIVGSQSLGAYGEVAYNVLRSLDTKHQLLPFFRAEYYDTLFSTEGVLPDDGTVATTDLVFGVSWRPALQVVYKADYIVRSRGGGGDGEQVFNLGVGFMY